MKYREKFSIKLDRDSYLFQSLSGEVGDVEVRFTQGKTIDESNADAFLFNKVTQMNPIIIHGNGLSKIPLNSLGNYLAKSWHPAIGCLSCDELKIDLNNLDSDEYPHVLLAINILKPTPFFPEFLEYITSLDYPKERITLFIQSLTDYNNDQVKEFLENYERFYKSVKYNENTQLEEWQLRNAYL